MINANIPIEYKPIFERKHLRYLYYGGRGGGKSYNIAQTLIIMSLMDKEKILCAREFQSSIEQSVKAVLVKWINELGLNSEFAIFKDKIIAKKTKSLFIFAGFNELNADKLRSLLDVTICWFEEANAMSEHSYNVIMPSVMRTKKSIAIFSMNPQFESDTLYENFILNKPPKYSYVKLVNADDNPFFNDSNLKYEREADLDKLAENRITKADFNNKWLGEPYRELQGAIFSDETIKGMSLNATYKRENYTRIVVSCDPALTSKKHSNKYGLIVCGLTKEGIAHIIQDSSNVFTPEAFANEANKLYTHYNADCIVVETNAGGDFLSYTLLSHNPKFKIREVRAIRDKVNRAMPIANLCAIGKIKFLTNLKAFENLVRQMRLLSVSGFNGSVGESPDSVDALVWGMFDLFNLSDTSESVFRLEWFKADSSYAFVESSNNLFLDTNHKEIAILTYSIVSNAKSQRRILITDCQIIESAELTSFDFGNANIICPDIPAFNHLEADFYDFNKTDGYLFSMQNIAHYKLNYIMIADNMPERNFNNLNGDLLRINLNRFNEKDKDNVAIKAINDLLIYHI